MMDKPSEVRKLTAPEMRYCSRCNGGRRCFERIVNHDEMTEYQKICSQCGWIAYVDVCR